MDVGAPGAIAGALRRRRCNDRRRVRAPARDDPVPATGCAAAHPNRSALFDLKHDPGGMVDVEFSVQYLVLLHSAGYPALTRNCGNIALLALAAEFGLIPVSLATTVADAYRAYRRAQHQI